MKIKKKNIKTKIFFVILVMLIIFAIKLLVLGFSILSLSAGIIGTGIVFAAYSLAASKNPEESENLFNSTLMGFALMETFIFLSFLVCYIIYIL